MEKWMIRRGEILVIGCIVLILGSMTLPVWTQVRAKNGLRTSASNLRVLAQASALYAADHEDQLPFAESEGRTYFSNLQPYIPQPSTCINPASPLAGQVTSRSQSTYGVNLSLAWGEKSVRLSEVKPGSLLMCDAAEFGIQRDRVEQSTWMHGSMVPTASVGGPANREPWSGNWTTHPAGSKNARSLPIAVDEGRVDVICVDGHLAKVDPNALNEAHEGSIWDIR